MTAAAISFAALTQGALAQTYPTKAIQIVVPFGAGGGTDVNARTVSEVVSKDLGQQIVIESRPGANGAIGSGIVAKAAPDGYTLLFTAQSTYSLNPNLMKDLPYDQIKDFVPVAAISDSPWYLTVSADSPFKTVEDVIKFAKANPDQLTAGFWQSTVLVTTVAFSKTAGFQMRRVPYKGATEAYTDLAAGRLQIAFADSQRSAHDRGRRGFVFWRRRPRPARPCSRMCRRSPSLAIRLCRGRSRPCSHPRARRSPSSKSSMPPSPRP